MSQFDFYFVTIFFRPGQEAQKIYKAVFPMDPTQVKTKLIGYGFSLLEGIDPNPDNYVCAGIIHTKTIQIGCLMRLEPNHSANVSNKFLYDEVSSLNPTICCCCDANLLLKNICA